MEKPGPVRAQALLSSGALWSTMVVLARARALLDLFHALVPGLARDFLEYAGRSPRERPGFLTRVYRTIPPLNFSHDLLSRARGLCVLALPRETGWSDLGTPERVRAWGRTRSGVGSAGGW